LPDPTVTDPDAYHVGDTPTHVVFVELSDPPAAAKPTALGPP